MSYFIFNFFWSLTPYYVNGIYLIFNNLKLKINEMKSTFFFIVNSVCYCAKGARSGRGAQFSSRRSQLAVRASYASVE